MKLHRSSAGWLDRTRDGRLQRKAGHSVLAQHNTSTQLINTIIHKLMAPRTRTRAHFKVTTTHTCQPTINPAAIQRCRNPRAPTLTPARQFATQKVQRFCTIHHREHHGLHERIITLLLLVWRELIIGECVAKNASFFEP